MTNNQKKNTAADNKKNITVLKNTLSTVEIVMRHVKEGFILVDADNNYMASNLAAAGMFPGIKKLAKGESIFSVKDWPHELKVIKNSCIEFSVTRKSTKYFKAGISPVYFEKKTLIAMIILIMDVTDSVNFIKELEKSAYIDSLTGLYTRKHFMELASKDIKRAARTNHSIYMAILDFDFFKLINDTYGHTTGDIVLKEIAELVHNTIRSYDLLGRYGGEEFVFLFSGMDETGVYKIAERIRMNIENNVISYEGNEIKLTCSIGLAKFLETDTLETSIKKADEVLYIAKNAGRNKVKIYGST